MPANITFDTQSKTIYTSLGNSHESPQIYIDVILHLKTQPWKNPTIFNLD